MEFQSRTANFFPPKKSWKITVCEAYWFSSNCWQPFSFFFIKGLLEPEFSLLAIVLYSLLKWAHWQSSTDQFPMQAPQANYALPKGQQEFLTKFWFIEK